MYSTKISHNTLHYLEESEREKKNPRQTNHNSLSFRIHLQLQGAFQEKEDENQRLKHYIDTILLNIVENYPQILEVKTPNGPETR